jgi:hypothetical protein
MSVADLVRTDFERQVSALVDYCSYCFVNCYTGELAFACSEAGLLVSDTVLDAVSVLADVSVFDTVVDAVSVLADV